MKKALGWTVAVLSGALGLLGLALLALAGLLYQAADGWLEET